MLTDKKGFTLFELAVILAGLSMAATAALPYFIRKAETTAAFRTARELFTLQEASKWYYLNSNRWPDSVQALKNSGYLNPSWPAVNPWGWSYSLSARQADLTTMTTVPDRVRGVLLRALPQVTSSGNGSIRTISSTVPAPGNERRVAEVKSLAEQALTEVRETAVPPHGPTLLFGTKINGRVTCPPGYAVIQTIRFGGRNNVGYICQSITRAESRLGELQRRLAELEARNQDLRSQNRSMESQINRIEDYFEDHREYRYWKNCVINRDCDDD